MTLYMYSKSVSKHKFCSKILMAMYKNLRSLVDPGIPVGVGAHFGENVCKNERIRSCMGSASVDYKHSLNTKNAEN